MAQFDTLQAAIDKARPWIFAGLFVLSGFTLLGFAAALWGLAWLLGAIFH